MHNSDRTQESVYFLMFIIYGVNKESTWWSLGLGLGLVISFFCQNYTSQGRKYLWVVISSYNNSVEKIKLSFEMLIHSQIVYLRAMNLTTKRKCKYQKTANWHWCYSNTFFPSFGQLHVSNIMFLLNVFTDMNWYSWILSF